MIVRYIFKKNVYCSTINTFNPEDPLMLPTKKGLQLLSKLHGCIQVPIRTSLAEVLE